MSKEVCSICQSDYDEEGEGGISGLFGICPVSFCVWCYSSLTDMFEKMTCEMCPGNKERIKEMEKEDTPKKKKKKKKKGS